MRRFSKTPQRIKWLDLWPDWDIVLELDQREGDPAPAFGISYTAMEVDWDDGNGPVTYTRTSSTATQTYAGAYPAGRHVVKMRVVGRYNAAGRIYFGNASGSTSTGEALMPQVVRVRKFDVSGTVDGRPKASDLQCVFNRCLRLEGVDCPFIVGAVTSLSYAFRFCVRLKGAVAVPHLANVTSLGVAFANCHSLEEARVGDAPSLISLTYAFQNCTSLRKAAFGALPKTLDARYAFSGCVELASITWKGHVDFSNLTFCFNNCRSLEEVPEIGDQPACTTLAYAFYGCRQLKHVALGDFPAVENLSYAFANCTALEEVHMTGLSNVIYAGSVCSYDAALRAVTLDGIGPACTNFANAFQFCTSMAGSFTLPDMPECTALDYAFYSTSLSSIVIGDAPKLATMSNICSRCFSLRSFKAGQMPKAYTLANAFPFCFSLEELELHIPGGTLTNAQSMCEQCVSLKRLKGEARLSPQGPSAASTWANIFNNCSSLEELPDIFPDGGWGSFTVANVAHGSWFNNCVSMSGSVPSWVWETWPGRDNVQDSTFLSCFRLGNYNDIPNYWKGGDITI